MGHLASVLKVSDGDELRYHIGSIFNFMEPLCKKFTEDQMDIAGWIPTPYQAIPEEQVCVECYQLNQEGRAYRRE